MVFNQMNPTGTELRFMKRPPKSICGMMFRSTTNLSGKCPKNLKPWEDKNVCFLNVFKAEQHSNGRDGRCVSTQITNTRRNSCEAIDSHEKVQEVPIVLGKLELCWENWAKIAQGNVPSMNHGYQRHGTLNLSTTERPFYSPFYSSHANMLKRMSYSYKCSWILDVKARFNDFAWSTHTLSSIFWSPARGTQSHLESQPSKTSVSSKSARSQKRSTQSPRWNTKENSMKYVNYPENYLKNSILGNQKASKSNTSNKSTNNLPSDSYTWTANQSLQTELFCTEWPENRKAHLPKPCWDT